MGHMFTTGQNQDLAKEPSSGGKELGNKKQKEKKRPRRERDLLRWLILRAHLER